MRHQTPTEEIRLLDDVGYFEPCLNNVAWKFISRRRESGYKIDIS
jgi:hypothetical protein